MSTEPEPQAPDRTRAPFGRGELNRMFERATRRPTAHPRHDEVRALLLDIPAAHGQLSNQRFRMGDHYTLFADGRAVWVKPERNYVINDWWTDDLGTIWAVDDGALDGLLGGLVASMRGVDGFVADLMTIRKPKQSVAPPSDDDWMGPDRSGV
ncbi:MAG: hypothetical protein H7338_10415 [Candidatus Sericytochromatia bacterium]|nr:hypothetical protein [Candidatus Sericytochromatia bacterium]